MRFADTAEQRELRVCHHLHQLPIWAHPSVKRQERSFKEGETDGEPSPGQLTIAQAALLNLRGQDLRVIGHPSPTSPPGVCTLPSVTSNLAMNPPVIGSTTQRVVGWGNASVSGISGREIIGSSREYGITSGLNGIAGQGLALGGSNVVGGGRAARLGNGASGIDYGSAFAGSPIGSVGTLPQQQLRQYQDVLSDGMGGMDVQNPFQMDYATTQRESASMGQQMRGGGLGRDGMMDPTMKTLLESLGGGVDQHQQDYYRMQLEHNSPSSYGQNLNQASINQLLQYPNYGGSGVASTATGYTPAEEYIMRAHVENVSRQMDIQQHPSAAQRKRPSPLDLGRQVGRRQEDSGADIGVGVRGYRMQASLVGMSDEEAFHAHARAEREAEHHQQQQQMDPTSVDQQQEHHHAHTRSTTLPHQQQNQHQHRPQRRNSVMTAPQTASVVVGGPSASGRGQARHYQHNSMSIPSTTAQRTPQHASVATMGGQMEQQQAAGQKLSYRTSYGGQQQQQHAGSQGYEDSLSHSPTTPSTDSSSLISPALTYSSQHTPSTLSPATPFFGSFGNQGDAFRGAGVVEGKGPIEHGKPHSLKTRIA